MPKGLKKGLPGGGCLPIKPIEAFDAEMDSVESTPGSSRKNGGIASCFCLKRNKS